MLQIQPLDVDPDFRFKITDRNLINLISQFFSSFSFTETYLYNCNESAFFRTRIRPILFQKYGTGPKKIWIRSNPVLQHGRGRYNSISSLAVQNPHYAYINMYRDQGVCILNGGQEVLHNYVMTQERRDLERLSFYRFTNIWR